MSARTAFEALRGLLSHPHAEPDPDDVAAAARDFLAAHEQEQESDPVADATDGASDEGESDGGEAVHDADDPAAGDAEPTGEGDTTAPE